MTITEIKAASKKADNHWFDPSTLKFFRSKILPKVYEGPGGIYFVSSEQFVDAHGVASTRGYSVRKFDPVTNGISTVGPFNEMTRERAQRIAAMSTTEPYL